MDEAQSLVGQGDKGAAPGMWGLGAAGGREGPHTGKRSSPSLESTMGLGSSPDGEGSTVPLQAFAERGDGLPVWWPERKQPGEAREARRDGGIWCAV